MQKIGYRYARRLPWIAPLRRVNALTCRGKTDGGGAQVQAIMSTYAYCRAVGLKYAHTPMTHVEHGSGCDWVSRWNSFLDWSDVSQLDPKSPLPHMRDAFSFSPRPLPIIWTDHMHMYCDRLPIAYENARSEFRRRCALVKNIVRGTMAVHIRRGDVAREDINANRRTPFDHVRRIIETARQNRPALDVSIYSEGEAEEFADFKNCDLHLGTDVFDTLDGMMNAEILVLAKSSFSFVAGLLSRGTVIYDPFWHSRLPSWVCANDYVRA